MLRLYSIIITVALLFVLAWSFLRNAAQRDQLDALNKTVAKFTEEKDEALAKANNLKKELESVKEASVLKAPKSVFESEMDSWLGRVGDLKDYLDRTPSLSIPELKYLRVSDWLDATKDKKLDTEADYRIALAQLRTNAKNIVTPALGRALKQYLNANGGNLPSSPRDFSQYLDGSLDPAILDRYSINTSGKISGLRGDAEFVLVETIPVDKYWDTSCFLTRNGGHGVRSVNAPETYVVYKAIQDYQAKTGTVPKSLADIDSYLKAKVSSEIAKQLFDAMTNPPSPGP